MAVKQPLAKCTAILTMCIVLHRPPPYAVTIHNTCQINLAIAKKIICSPVEVNSMHAISGCCNNLPRFGTALCNVLNLQSHKLSFTTLAILGLPKQLCTCIINKQDVRSFSLLQKRQTIHKH